FPRVAFAILICALAVSSAARAATTCTIDATTAVDFNTYDYTSATPNDSTGTITCTCRGAGGLFGGGAAVTLSQGSSGTYSQRTMLSGANVLAYNLYVDAARTQVWGDFTGGTSGQFAAPRTPNQQLSIYGRIPTGQNVP